MKHIQLNSRTEFDWSGKFVDQSNYDQLLNESSLVYKPDGSLLLALFKGGHSRGAVASAWAVLKDWNQSTNNRGTAAGSGSRRVRNQTVGDTVTSGIVGFFERTARFPYCRACAWNLEHPEKMANLLPICHEASNFYAQVGGWKYENQRKAAAATRVDFKIPGTVFSTLTLNKNFRTACHKDAGNLKNTLNAMSLFREGKFNGGHVVLPDFRVAAQLETGDCIVFDAHEFHGNTPIIPLSKNYTRCTVVFYYREGMDKCLDANGELERAKRRQRGEKLMD